MLEGKLKERWKDVVGYEDTYQVSSKGRVRRGRIGSRIRKPFQQIRTMVDMHGYPCVDLYYGKGYWRRLRVHRLVLSAFRGLPKPGQLSRHLNDIKTDNYLSNLKWGTKSENHFDYYRNGGTRGFRNPKVLRKAMKSRGVW